MIKKDSRIVKLNDALFYKLIHLKWEMDKIDYCIVCAAEKNIKNFNVECAHLISKSHLLTRWDPRNVIPLCADHHRLSSEFSAHKTPKKFDNFLAEHFATQWNYLKTVRGMIMRRNQLPWTLQEKRAELERELELYENLPF